MPGPHDTFVRHTFDHPENAAAELRAVLPEHVVSQVDWPSLRVESSSVVDSDLRETESDLLFSARLRGGHPLLLYVLLEHQSSVDRWMALRMLRYVVRLLERWPTGAARNSRKDCQSGWRFSRRCRRAPKAAVTWRCSFSTCC
jgi:predicted transposase/invertase (TIGR01784 family)